MRRWSAACALAAACVGTAIGAAGCGGSAGSVIDPVARAASVSTRAPGYRMLMSMQLSAAGLPTPITATGQGSFDVPDHSGALALDMNLGNIPQVTQVLGSSTLHIEEAFKGLVFYIKLPASLVNRIPAFSKPWMKIDVASAGRAAGIPGLGSLAANPASGDPSQFLGYLRATSGGVNKVGTQSVNGVQTTHYRAQIELDRVPNAFPASARAQVRQAVAAMQRVGHVRLLPVDVWIDGQHLVRRMRLAFGESVSGQALNAAIRIDIPEYGPQPAPTLPPANQVMDLTKLAAGASSAP